MKANDLERNAIETVVYVADNNYLWPFLVSLYTAHTNAKREIRYILGYNVTDLSPTSISTIVQFANRMNINLTFLPLEKIKQVEMANHVSLSAYHKLQIFDVLKEAFLYVDSDTIMCVGWDVILDGDYFSSSNIVLSAHVEHTNSSNAMSENLAKRRSGDLYFNSGVMVVNPMRWRQLEFDKVWKGVAGDRDNLRFDLNDQDVLNYLLPGHVKQLDAKFNYFANDLGPMEVTRSDVSNPAIIHYVGECKPWNFSESDKLFFRLLNLTSIQFSFKHGEFSWCILHYYEEYWATEIKVIAFVTNSSSPDLLKLLHHDRNIGSNLKVKIKTWLSGLLLKRLFGG